MVQAKVRLELINKLVQKLGNLLPDRYAASARIAVAKVDSILNGTDESARSQRMALTVFIIRVMSAIIAFFSQVLLARWMGDFEYGIFVAIWAAVIILETLVSFGMPSGVIRFVSKYREEKRNSHLWGVVYGSAGLTFITSTLFTMSAILLLQIKPDLLATNYLLPALLALICIPVISVASIAEATSRAFDWTFTSFIPTFVLRPLTILGLFWCALVFGFDASAVTAIWVALFATYIVSLSQIWRVSRKLYDSVPRSKPEFKLKYWFLVAVPIFLVESFYVLLTMVDVIFVSILTTPEETAVYFATTKILALVHFVYFAVRAASAHRYSSLHTSGNKLALKNYVTQSVAWTFWPSLMLGIFMFFTGEYFLWLFGPEYIVGASILWILISGILIRASVGPAESLLVMTGNQNTCAMIYIGALFINVTLNLSLIPIYGLKGAAMATALAMTFESLALYTVIKRKLGIHSFVFTFSGKKHAETGTMHNG